MTDQIELHLSRRLCNQIGQDFNVFACHIPHKEYYIFCGLNCFLIGHVRASNPVMMGCKYYRAMGQGTINPCTMHWKVDVPNGTKLQCMK